MPYKLSLTPTARAMAGMSQSQPIHLDDPLLQEIGQTINEEKNAPKTAEQLAKNHQFWLAKQAE